MNAIRVGTRGSALALTQTRAVIAALQVHHPDLAFEPVIVKTTGDARQNVPFSAVGTKGMFVKEIEEALLAGQVDFAVHSLKDMPGELAPGLVLAAVPEREDPRDALVSRGQVLEDLPQGARVGTSSLRRKVQLLAARQDVVVDELRGNLDTRLKKLDAGQYDAIVVACAGLARMGWDDRIVQTLSPEVCVPAPGQGALALEARAGDARIHGLLAPLNHAATADAVAAERAFQAALNAGCTVPAGAYAWLEGDRLRLVAFMSREDGTEMRRASESGPRNEATALGERAARWLV